MTNTAPQPVTPERTASKPPASKDQLPYSADELIARVQSYSADTDRETLARAYAMAAKQHKDQTRDSGEPYFAHPLRVTSYLVDLRMDLPTVVTALLHDVVEDTDLCQEDIEREFGKEIARLVCAVTKVTRQEGKPREIYSAENFGKLLIGMAEDIRVILVKFSDRLDNMRTLQGVREDKRKRIARETLEIYVPLAARIGMAGLKEELEDLSFAQLYPGERAEILKKLGKATHATSASKNEIETALRACLKEHGLEAEVYGRVKSAYSIWRKMASTDLALEQLGDITAFRILVESQSDCYTAMGLVHQAFSVVPGRFKDYISLPKPNGYRSIHTGIIGPNQQPIEVQIRTREMHQINEWGVAAHWAYKAGKGKPEKDDKVFAIVRSLLDVWRDSEGPSESMENTRLELFDDEVYVYSPKGEIYTLPTGSCPLDFAYAVHSEVGNRCFGANVNGHMRPLSSTLRSGDQVEILTRRDATPSSSWLAFVKTGKARAAIRRFQRQVERDQYVRLGREMLLRELRAEGMKLEEKDFEAILPRYNLKTFDDLLVGLASGHRSVRELLHAAYPELLKARRRASLESRGPKKTSKKAGDQAKGPGREQARTEKKKQGLEIEGLIPGMAIHYARCCRPLPGDRIVGIVTTGKGVTIHTRGCSTLERFHDDPNRWLPVSWNKDLSELRDSQIKILLSNRPGSLAAATAQISRNEGNIMDARTTWKDKDFMEMRFNLEVKDREQLDLIMAALRSCEGVISVGEVRG